MRAHLYPVYCYLTSVNTCSFLVGLNESDINLVGKLYPDDPTQVGNLLGFGATINRRYFTLYQGSPFGVGMNDTITYVFFIIK